MTCELTTVPTGYTMECDDTAVAEPLSIIGFALLIVIVWLVVVALKP
jgi:hypothetical protein